MKEIRKQPQNKQQKGQQQNIPSQQPLNKPFQQGGKDQYTDRKHQGGCGCS